MFSLELLFIIPNKTPSFIFFLFDDFFYDFFLLELFFLDELSLQIFGETIRSYFSRREEIFFGLFIFFFYFFISTSLSLEIEVFFIFSELIYFLFCLL